MRVLFYKMFGKHNINWHFFVKKAFSVFFLFLGCFEADYNKKL